MQSLRLRDFLTMYRYRNQIVPLDYGVALTRGSPFSAASMLSHLDPLQERFTAMSSLAKGDPPLFGQIRRRQACYQARLLFLTPEENIQPPALTSLVEVLIKQAGEWGAYYLTAELEERNPVFYALRKEGFTVYARQRIWKLPETLGTDTGKNSRWELPRPGDELHIRALYDALVPGLVQQVEIFTLQNGQGLIYRHKGEVLAYVEGVFGPEGILLQPLVHPEVENANELLSQLPACFEPLMGRPVYIGVRSYQAWLEGPLEDLQAEPSPRLALLVRYLANIRRELQENKRFAVLDAPHVETPATVFQNFIHHN